MPRQEENHKNELVMQKTEKGKKTSRSWAEEHGGLVFLMICIVGVSLAILCDSCMY
jgi:hypothetical protein